MKKLVLETTAPFQGLPELVADDEGLFAKEGLHDRMGRPRERATRRTRLNVNSPKGLNPFSSHGKMLEQGQADMYNACEWGNYCRVQDTKVGSRQVGRRGIVSYAAIVVRPDSPVFTAQQLAEPHGRRAVLFRHPLSRTAPAGRLPAARSDQALPRAERLALALRRDDARRDRGHHADRALRDAGREEGLPADLRGVLSRHRSRLGPGRRRDLCRLQPRGARSGAAHRREQARLSATISSTTTRRIRRSRRSSPRTSARAASWCAIRRRSRSTRCSAPTSGSKSWGMLEETATPLDLVNLAGAAARDIRRRNTGRSSAAPAPKRHSGTRPGTPIGYFGSAAQMGRPAPIGAGHCCRDGLRRAAV